MFQPVEDWQMPGVKRLVVEIQLHLKVSVSVTVLVHCFICFMGSKIACCTFLRIWVQLKRSQDLHEKAQELSSVHYNYIEARNLRSQ